ncbi:MAG: hypothetical protein ABIJ42_09885 [Acidobacteriota bacterium]
MSWIIVPCYAFAPWVGTLILGMPGTGIPPGLDLSEILSREFPGWIMSQWVLLIPAFKGSIMVAFPAVGAYITAITLLVKFRSHGIKLAKALDT